MEGGGGGKERGREETERRVGEEEELIFTIITREVEVEKRRVEERAHFHDEMITLWWTDVTQSATLALQREGRGKKQTSEYFTELTATSISRNKIKSSLRDLQTPVNSEVSALVAGGHVVSIEFSCGGVVGHLVACIPPIVPTHKHTHNRQRALTVFVTIFLSNM